MKKAISYKTLLLSTITLLSFNLFAQSSEEARPLSEVTHPKTARLPLNIIARPGTMPKGIIQVDTSASVVGKIANLKAASQFGILDNLEGQFSYDGLEFAKGYDAKKIFKRTVNLGAKYTYFNIPHVSFSASASMPIHILDGEIVKDMTLGLPTVFYNQYMAGSLLGDLFHLTMRKNIEMGFDFKFWYGVQICDKFWAMVDSSFGKIEMKNETNQSTWTRHGFWKVLPANLAATYTFNHYVDLGANFGFDDVFKAKDTMKFGLTLSLRGGRLFS